MQPLFGAIALDSHMAQHKAALLLVAAQGCLTQKAALWYDLWSLAFLVTAGRGVMRLCTATGGTGGNRAWEPGLLFGPFFVGELAASGSVAVRGRWWCGHYSMGGGKVQLALDKNHNLWYTICAICT